MAAGNTAISGLPLATPLTGTELMPMVQGGITCQVATQDLSVGVKYTSGAVGAVARTVQDKLRDGVSLADVGGVGDGVVNDAASLLNAVTYDDAKLLSTKAYAMPLLSAISANLNRLFGRGVIRTTDFPASPLITDIGGFDLAGTNQAIAGASQFAMLDNQPYADMTRIQAALMASTCNVTFLGDSLTETNGNQSWYESAWTRQFMRMLDASFTGVQFNYSNLGLNGCQSAQAIDPAFTVGTAPYFTSRVKPTTFPVGLGWWSRGATASDAVISCAVAGGTGYTQGQAVTFSAPAAGGLQATGTLNVTAGVPTSITMTCMGDRYAGLTPTASATGGVGCTFSPVVGSKAWRDFVRDSSPDVLLIGLGQNDMGPAPTGFTANIQSYIDFTKTWVKVPTIILVSTHQPTRLDPTYANYQNVLEAAARAMRMLAIKNKCLCIDTYRMFRWMRDGVDDKVHAVVKEANTRNFPTWWTARSGAMPTGTSTVTSTNNFQVFRSGIKARDIVFNTSVTLNSTAQIPQFYYRNRISNAGGATGGGTGYLVMLVYSAPNWFLQFWVNGVASTPHVNLTALGLAPILGTPLNISIDATDHRHRVYVNAVLVKDVTDYGTFESGEIGFGMAGAATAGTQATWVTTLSIGVPRKIGRPLLSDVDYFGINDFATNSQDSLGGNGINHPSTQGQMSYIAACGSVIRKIVDYYQAKN